MITNKHIRDVEFLRSLAQNDYMIDGKLLDDGTRLTKIADRLEQLLTAVRMTRVVQNNLEKVLAEHGDHLKRPGEKITPKRKKKL